MNVKIPLSDCVFVSKREFNGTISSKFLPLPQNYAVSREKMAEICKKSIKTKTKKCRWLLFIYKLNVNNDTLWY